MVSLSYSYCCELNVSRGLPSSNGEGAHLHGGSALLKMIGQAEVKTDDKHR